MAVDASGQNQHASGVDDLVGVGQRFPDGDDAPVLDPDIGLVGLACGSDRAVTNDSVEGSHGSYLQITTPNLSEAITRLVETANPTR